MNTVEFTMPVPNPNLGCPMIGELEVKAETGLAVLPFPESKPRPYTELEFVLWQGIDILPLLKSLPHTEDTIDHICEAARTAAADQDPAIIGEGAEAESEL